MGSPNRKSPLRVPELLAQVYEKVPCAGAAAPLRSDGLDAAELDAVEQLVLVRCIRVYRPVTARGAAEPLAFERTR
jgi:hypothetical protein